MAMVLLLYGYGIIIIWHGVTKPKFIIINMNFWPASVLRCCSRPKLSAESHFLADFKDCTMNLQSYQKRLLVARPVPLAVQPILLAVQPILLAVQPILLGGQPILLAVQPILPVAQPIPCSMGIKLT